MQNYEWLGSLAALFFICYVFFRSKASNKHSNESYEDPELKIKLSEIKAKQEYDRTAGPRMAELKKIKKQIKALVQSPPPRSQQT